MENESINQKHIVNLEKDSIFFELDKKLCWGKNYRNTPFCQTYKIEKCPCNKSKKQ